MFICFVAKLERTARLANGQGSLVTTSCLLRNEPLDNQTWKYAEPVYAAVM